ncbi:hypothetical protein FQR65_LT06150 [Abscondita terminalis]|nr:hypothetical protein FQR65_LT06150 [Abscondita terminalis]
MWFFLAIAFISLILYFYLKRNDNYWKHRGIPYTKPVFFFGNILNMIKGKEQTSEMLKTLYESTTAPYIGFFMFDQPYLLIRDLDLIKNILITDFDYFSDRGAVTSEKDAVGSKLLFLLKGAAWRDLRRSSTCLFSMNKIKSLVPLINKIGDDLIEHLDKHLEKDVVDGRFLGLNFGVDVISSCVFGFEANAVRCSNSVFVKSALKLLEVTISRGIQTVLCFFSPKLVNLLNLTFTDVTATSTLSSIFLRVCKDRKATGTKRGDFVDILNTMTMNGEELDDKHMAGLAIQMLLAGHETSGTTVGFLLYELCYNVDVQNRLHKEVKNVLKDNDNKISYETINQMTYLDMVINKILRKYPVVGFLDRICLTNYRVPGTNYTIEKGIPVIIPVYALHQDDRYYSEPEKFDPERFSPDNKNSIPTCAYMPFGEGLRYCIGNQLALLTIKIFIIKILANFNIGCCKDTPKFIKFDTSSILLCPQKGELKVKLIRI